MAFDSTGIYELSTPILRYRMAELSDTVHRFGRMMRAAVRVASRLLTLLAAAWQAPLFFDAARGRPVSVRRGELPSRAADSAPSPDSNPWWMVDLEAEWPIHAIRVHNNAGNFWDHGAHVLISISTDQQVWQFVHGGIHYFGSTSATGPLEVRLLEQHRARYIRLELPRHGRLSPRRVEILVRRSRVPGLLSRLRRAGHRLRAQRAVRAADRPLPELINVAPRGTASQSSIDGTVDTHGPAIGNSGDTGGRRFFATKPEHEPWWMVDLGLRWPIERIRVYNRRGPGSALAARLVVSVSNDGTEWTRIHEGTHYFDESMACGPLDVCLLGMLTARFVRLELPGMGTLSLRQVEVLVDRRLVDLRTACARYGLAYDMMVQGHFIRPGRLHYAIENAPARYDGRIDAFHVTCVVGRFGNHLKTIMHAACLARATGVARVYLPRLDQFEIDAPLEADGVTLLPEHMLPQERPGVVLTGSFYYSQGFDRLFGHQVEDCFGWAMRNFARPLFKRSAVAPPFMPGDTDLVIHIRSGDIFRKQRPHPDYVQPPLSFYQIIIRFAVHELGIQRAILIFEDERNPCIGALNDWLRTVNLAFVVQSASVREDIATLLHARHCVFGSGTFGPAIVRLSERMWTVFFPWTMPGADTAAAHAGIRSIAIRDAAGRYMAKGTWSGSPEQLRLMLDYPVENLALDDPQPRSQPVSCSGENRV